MHGLRRGFGGGAGARRGGEPGQGIGFFSVSSSEGHGVGLGGTQSSPERAGARQHQNAPWGEESIGCFRLGRLDGLDIWLYTRRGEHPGRSALIFGAERPGREDRAVTWIMVDDEAADALEPGEKPRLREGALPNSLGCYARLPEAMILMPEGAVEGGVGRRR